MTSPKTAFYAPYIVSGNTTVVGTEDPNFWKYEEKGLLKLDDIGKLKSTEVLCLAEVLQRVDDPVAILKDAATKCQKILITVPNEWSWAQEYKPFTNKAHKRFYDAESLAKDLESAGLSYVMRVIDFSGWSFLSVEATRA